ncbi:tyrosine-type recombinase/integrase [Streptomyces sp. NPDC056831]|uniref:tyrosine-type recombinase/integrase n=1 Tax=Streptomyces sp. NPDC056831 TaxID=3345954 RepID=UPI0036A3390B
MSGGVQFAFGGGLGQESAGVMASGLRSPRAPAAENEAAEREGRKPIELPHMVTHGLRHFYASALIGGGASVKQVQMVLGHASAVVTLRNYAHLWPGEENRTRSVMDAVLGGLRTGCGQVGDATRESAGQAA